jgi:hypothetical protein
MAHAAESEAGTAGASTDGMAHSAMSGVGWSAGLGCWAGKEWAVGLGRLWAKRKENVLGQ